MARARSDVTDSPAPVTTGDLVSRRELWPVNEAAHRLGVNRTTLYRLRAAGQLRFVKVGGRTFVTDAELRRFVANVEAAS